MSRRERIASLLLFIPLLIPNLVGWTLIAGNLPYQLVGILCSLLFLLLPFAFLPIRHSLLIGYGLLILYPLELVGLLSLGTPLNYSIFRSILATSAYEAQEALSGYVPQLLLFAFGYMLYGWLIFRYAPQRVFMRKRIRVGALGALILLLLLLTALVVPKNEEAKSYVTKRYIPTLAGIANSCFPLDILRYSRTYLKAERELKHILSLRGTPKSNSIRVKDSVPEDLLGVLVIGETSRACNWQLAGYERDTNPRLCTRSNLYFFPKAYSGANITLRSVPMLISPATPEQPLAWQHEPFITEILKPLGFKEAWISGQSLREVWNGLAQKPCDRIVNLGASFPAPRPYDGDQLLHLKAFIEGSPRRTFAVLHQNGGHLYYPLRYPDSFAVFQPLPEKVLGLTPSLQVEDRPLLINAFDNTIVYTDFVLDSAIQILEETHRPAFLVYIADHGENIFDTEKNLIGHGSSTPTHYELHVPMFVWLSEEYRQRYPATAVSLKSELRDTVSSTRVFSLLLGLLGTSTADSTH